MKAAAVAASRGHAVVLYERERSLGGQARLAQRLPGREEFGGIIANLEREMTQSGVRVRKGETVTRATIDAERPDAVILATGARVYRPAFEGLESAHVLDAWEVLEERANVGASVAIADWRADWIGLGLAERLARAGCRVTLCLNAAMAGESLQIYTRNHYLGRLHKLGVAIRTHLRLFGADGRTIYFQDTLTSEAVLLEEVDTLVLALGHEADDDLERALAGSEIPIACIGDCVVPRTAEEAVYEGLVTAWKI
jgi:NADPH-dependent 2,4-dienoyl-CoA reductase/sulfur reductase-like enzyme